MRTFEERWMRRLGPCNLKKSIKEVSSIPKTFRDDVLKMLAKAKVFSNLLQFALA